MDTELNKCQEHIRRCVAEPATVMNTSDKEQKDDQQTFDKKSHSDEIITRPEGCKSCHWVDGAVLNSLPTEEDCKQRFNEKNHADEIITSPEGSISCHSMNGIHCADVADCSEDIDEHSSGITKEKFPLATYSGTNISAGSSIKKAVTNLIEVQALAHDLSFFDHIGIMGIYPVEAANDVNENLRNVDSKQDKKIGGVTVANLQTNEDEKEKEDPTISCDNQSLIKKCECECEDNIVIEVIPLEAAAAPESAASDKCSDTVDINGAVKPQSEGSSEPRDEVKSSITTDMEDTSTNFTRNENFQKNLWKEKTPSSPPVCFPSSGETTNECDLSIVNVKKQSKWKPPSISLANEYRQKTLFREGRASLWKSDLCNAEDLSEGVALYFEFARSACVCLMALSALSIPSIIFSFSGSRISIADRDAMGFYRFTVGNIGYDTESPTYVRDSACSMVSRSYTGTCFQVFGVEIRSSDADLLMAFMEFAQTIVFFLFIYRLSRRTLKNFRGENHHDCSVIDYAVMCRKLPKDATAAQLTKHFNQLYPLNDVDWQNRRAVPRTRVVANCENSGDATLIGTWIADSIVFSAIGKGLSAFKLHQNWIIDLIRSRALVSMYSSSTSHKHGPDSIRRLNAEIKLRVVEKKIEKLADNLNIHKDNLIAVEREDCEMQDMTSNKMKLTIKANVVAAFVTFQYSESMKRCLNDYSYYNSFPRNLFYYPANLKFRGQRIQVEVAPDPGEVIWEHLEISKGSKRLRRILTTLLSIFFLTVSFAAILQAGKNKEIFMSKIPSDTLCLSTIPGLYVASTNTSMIEKYSIVRPDILERPQLDFDCNAVIPGSYYGVFSSRHNIYSPVAEYNIKACNTSSALPLSPNRGSCPKRGQRIFCPCIATIPKETCYSSACGADPSSSNNNDNNKKKNCVSFSDSVISSCYCHQTLKEILSIGIVATYNYIQDIPTSSQRGSCKSFFADYSTAQGISYGTILISLFINTLLVHGMKRLSSFEAHVSVDKANAALMVKLFVVTYINMAFAVLIAFGNIRNLPSILQRLYIFQGQYGDFSSKWYNDAGVYFLSSFLVQAVLDTLYKLGMLYIVTPFKQCVAFPSIRARSSHRIVTQFELNQIVVGPVFDPSVSNAYFLSVLFFAMTYSAGLPIMMPMACAALNVLRFMDRLLLLRLNMKPPQMGDEVMQLTLKILPFAAIIRLTFACWMMSCSDVFDTSQSYLISSSDYGKWLQKTHNDCVQFFIDRTLDSNRSAVINNVRYGSERFFRPNVFPLMVLLIFVITMTTVILFWKVLPFFWVKKTLSYFYKLSKIPCRSVKVHIEREEGVFSSRESDIRVLRSHNKTLKHSAPFTGEYFCHLKKFFGPQDYLPATRPGAVRLLNDFQKSKLKLFNSNRHGWAFIDSQIVEGRNARNEDLGNVYKIKKWTHEATDGSIRRHKGDPKMTYEVINDNGSSSYALEKIQGYALVIKGLKEGSYMCWDNQCNEANL